MPKFTSTIFIIIIVILLSIVGVSLYLSQCCLDNKDEKLNSLPIETQNDQGIINFAPEIERILNKNLEFIVELVKDPVVITAVKKENDKHKNISREVILSLDAEWRSAEEASFLIEPFLTNDLAIKLTIFQEDHPGFSEIFVTDQYGLNIGQTNKTTDYYQADEDWWINAFNSGAGLASHGPIEFYESVQEEAISLYVPIYDPASGSVIGIAKAVLSISAIKVEL